MLILKKNQSQFNQIQHARCGGASTFRTLWSHSLSTTLSVIAQPFRRTIRHFIDGSEQHGIWKNEPLPNICSEVQLLPAHNMTVVIKIKDNNRYLLRPLSGKELGFLWNLPRQVTHLITSPTDLPIVPVSIPDQIIQSYLKLLPQQELRRLDDNSFPTPVVPSDKNESFIPSLGVHLPSQWQNHATQHDKAAKNDDAAVNVGLWDYRILALFPTATVTHLNTL